MKRFSLMLLALSSLVVCQQASAAIIITEVMSSSSHPGGSSNSDWFELTNNGPLAVDITGWSWDDNQPVAGTAKFGSITSIAAGQSIIFTEETLGAEAAWRTDWNAPAGVTIVNLGGSGIPAFSSDGDEIHIFNAANVEVTSVKFNTATAGSTFAWDNQGNFLGISVAGQDGAYVASRSGAAGSLPGSGTDIGSPGFAVAAVPEPSTLVALGAIGVGAVVRKRMRRRA